MTDQYAGPPRYAEPPRDVAYAPWGIRVGAYLIDNLVFVPAAIVDFLTLEPDGGSTPFAIVLYVAAALFTIWNVVFRQGKTGQTIGKQLLHITLVSEAAGQPIGPMKSFLRQLAHFLDGLCYVGYLWPLWDPKRQTFADKIMKTIVVIEARHAR